MQTFLCFMVSGTAIKVGEREENEANKFSSGVQRDYLEISYVES